MEAMIGLASDHAGYELKQYVKQYLEEQGIPRASVARQRPHLRPHRRFARHF